MNELFQSIILGIVQGLTEFLPVSSSAHLNLFPWIFNWDKISDSFDVALHFGTLLAICVFFFQDWIDLIKGGFSVAKNFIDEKFILKSKNKNIKVSKSKVNSSSKKEIEPKTALDGKMFWYLVAATIPAGILSLVLDKLTDLLIGDNLNLEMAFIGVALLVMGIILYFVDKNSDSKVEYDKISFKQSMLVGASQALAAAFPGVSRSGITMTIARALKINRESAAKFSFLLATPIVAAAVLFDFNHFTFSPEFFLGILASFLSGVLVIKFLMDYLKKGSFKVFAVYRVVLAIIVFTLLIVR